MPSQHVILFCWCPPLSRQCPQVLISSGDDGWLHQWDTGAWGSDGSTIKPQHSFDLNAWVVKELKGQIVKVHLALPQSHCCFAPDMRVLRAEMANGLRSPAVA